MAGSKDMNIYDNRLASFRQKRRPSVAAGGKPVPTKWPHEQPSARELAGAGFFFNYTGGHPDNVTCYLCAKDLDGWEKDDDPSVEHLKHCPDCGWARVAVAQAMDDDQKHVEDPRGERMREARLDTFGRSQVWWPHEDKKGWVPKVEKMADAGWHYAPTKESDDFAICAYCELSLDGWEATDNPLEEHQRRSASCIFFNWKPTATKRPTRRASRASMQSVLGASDDESTLKTTKKAPRTKKPKRLDLEPESIFEDAPRGRKRPSTAAQQGPIIIYDGSRDTDEESERERQPPAQKKRATRASLAKQPGRDGDHLKMNDSDNDSHASIASVASKAGGKSKPKAKKAAARRASRVRGTSVARKPAKQPALPSDDEIDRALALDLDRPLTDEEEGFKDFKKPFIRPMKRLTRSRASLAVEEKMRDAPPDSILNSTKIGRSRAPAAEGERSPTKKFFRESSQDFSMPVRVPKHLAVEVDLGEVEGKRSQSRKMQEEVAERIIKGISRECTDAEETESKPLKKAPAKKAVRGRKKVSEATTVTEDEPEAPRPKRGRPAMKKTIAAGSTGPNTETEGRIEPEVMQEEEKPKKGRKRLVKGVNLKRDSVVSVISTAFSVEEPVAEPEHISDPKQSFIDLETAGFEEVIEVSDEGSVIHHDIHSQHPVLAPSQDHTLEPQEAETSVEIEYAPGRPKRTKKTSTSKTLKKEKRTTRSSFLSTASTTSPMTADPNINSGEESDVSRHSSIDVKKGRKVVKKASKRQLLAQQAKLGRALEDALKKGSESFFNSSQSEEMREVKRGKGKKVEGSIAGSTRGSFAMENVGSSVRESFADKMSVANSSVHGSFAEGNSMRDSSSVRDSLVEGGGSFTSGRGPFAEPGSLRSSFVSDSGDVQMVEVSAETEKEDGRSTKANAAAAAAGGRVVSFADNYPRLSANTDQDELSTTDADVGAEEEEDRISSPINIAPSPARIPLSPVRRAVNVPLASTPKSHTKASSTLASQKPWTAVDLDTVFANLNAGGEEGDHGEVGLSNKEKEMTVSEWIKWNAAQAEFRMTGEAERVIGVLEREGRRAVSAVEGVDTVD